ncbi:hypothetical protein [Burkholderia sp. lig30]|nr:hypothetical protein [Burkholderia sp. lig30]
MDEMLAGKDVAPSKRPNLPVDCKRALVEQTREPGASVSLVA